MSQKDQLRLPIERVSTKQERKGHEIKPSNITELSAFKREKEQCDSNRRMKEYLDSYKIFV